MVRGGCVPVMRPKLEEFVANVAFVPVAVTERELLGAVKLV